MVLIDVQYIQNVGLSFEKRFEWPTSLPVRFPPPDNLPPPDSKISHPPICEHLNGISSVSAVIYVAIHTSFDSVLDADSGDIFFCSYLF